MNEIGTIFIYLTTLSLGISILIFGIYGSLLVYYNKFKRSKREITYKLANPLEINAPAKKMEYEPTISIVVPTHNEKSIIEKKIQNLLDLNYAKEKMEIIFVDDSDDTTTKIIDEYTQKFPFVRLLHFDKRMGYSPSLIAGCKMAKGEIVVFAEASSFLAKDAIYHLVKNFANPKIGAVTGKDMLLNSNEGMGKSENAYLKILDFVREGESLIDSTVYMKGEAAAVRKELINDLEKLNAPGTADTAIALFVRSKGFRFIFDPKVTFYEYSPSTREGRIKQKTIRAANLIKVIWSFKNLFFKRESGKFGSVVLPFNFAMLTIAPLLIMLSMISLAVFAFFEPILGLIIWGIIGLCITCGLIISRSITLTFFEFEYSLLKACFEILFIRKSHDKIEKVESTRRI
jgi:cellulose synthase/poly-beta-1,6-N-acetylglucosamine synthase-like glycosyltransferase